MDSFSAEARRLGLVSSGATIVLIILYVAALAIGLATLPSPDLPIADPWFTAMEVLILLLMPVIVLFLAAVHAYADLKVRPFALAALGFGIALTVVTSSLHFCILTLGRTPEFQALATAPLMLSFNWPSVVYALDILAWDVFFALMVLSLVPVFAGPRLNRAIRWTLGLSGLLALAGLGGVVTGDMLIRDIGIIGYVLIYPIAVGMIGLRFRQKSASS